MLSCSNSLNLNILFFTSYSTGMHHSFNWLLLYRLLQSSNLPPLRGSGPFHFPWCPLEDACHAARQGHELQRSVICYDCSKEINVGMDKHQ